MVIAGGEEIRGGVGGGGDSTCTCGGIRSDRRRVDGTNTGTGVGAVTGDGSRALACDDDEEEESTIEADAADASNIIDVMVSVMTSPSTPISAGKSAMSSAVIPPGRTSARGPCATAATPPSASGRGEECVVGMGYVSGVGWGGVGWGGIVG